MILGAVSFALGGAAFLATTFLAATLGGGDGDGERFREVWRDGRFGAFGAGVLDLAAVLAGAGFFAAGLAVVLAEPVEVLAFLAGAGDLREGVAARLAGALAGALAERVDLVTIFIL